MIYKNALITTKDEQFLGWIEIDKNKIIKKIGKGQTNQEGVDCQNKIVMPGFIDSHTHGGYGFSFDNLNDQQSINNYLQQLKKEGITGVVGTSVTTDLNELSNKLNLINNLSTINNDVKVIAWYFEGPFISKSKKGAHEEKLIIPLDENFLKEAKKIITNIPILLTIDAEEKQNRDLVNKYQNDFIFALGHSNANYEDALNMLQNGTKRITHLYNAMSGFHHSTNLGILNVLFNKEYKSDLCIELIADGVHVSDYVIKYTYENFPIDNLTLVTDSLSPKGLSNGDYKLGNLDIEKRENWFYLKNSNTLSGSGITYNWLLKHFKEVTKCSWPELVKVSSYNSAKNMNLENIYGSIKEGQKANFIIVDEYLNIIDVII